MTEAQFDYQALDPGVREVVAHLHRRGFETTSSGDGVAKDFADSDEAAVAHVAVAFQQRNIFEETRDLYACLEAFEPGEWRIEACYALPEDQAVLLAMRDRKAHELEFGAAPAPGPELLKLIDQNLRAQLQPVPSVALEGLVELARRLKDAYRPDLAAAYFRRRFNGHTRALRAAAGLAEVLAELSSVGALVCDYCGRPPTCVTVPGASAGDPRLCCSRCCDHLGKGCHLLSSGPHPLES